MRLFLWVNAAFIYDMLIIGALSVALSAVFLGIAGENYEQNHLVRIIFQILWLSMISSYYLISWKKDGQTIGMRAWKLKVVRQDKATLTTRDIFVRFACAMINLLLLNLGWIGYLFSNRRSLTDILSKTHIEHIAKNG